MSDPEKERRPKVAVVMPAYNAEKTVARTYADIPRDTVDDVILVDDASSDRTVEEARRLGLHVVEHPENRGYGANQKTCYRTALERGAVRSLEASSTRITSSTVSRGMSAYVRATVFSAL
jgi:glycosyltransferase involved in cell wall biosynthesis